MYNQHTKGMETTRHRSLVERGERKALLETLQQTREKMSEKKQISTNLKERFEHKKLPAKLLDYFLRSNKSNINQSKYCKQEYIRSLIRSDFRPCGIFVSIGPKRKRRNGLFDADARRSVFGSIRAHQTHSQTSVAWPRL